MSGCRTLDFKGEMPLRGGGFPLGRDHLSECRDEHQGSSKSSVHVAIGRVGEFALVSLFDSSGLLERKDREL